MVAMSHSDRPDLDLGSELAERPVLVAVAAAVVWPLSSPSSTSTDRDNSCDQVVCEECERYSMCTMGLEIQESSLDPKRG